MTKSSLNAQVAPVMRGILDRTTGSAKRLASHTAIMAAISRRAASSSGRGFSGNGGIHPAIEESEDAQDHCNRRHDAVQGVEETPVAAVRIKECEDARLVDDEDDECAHRDAAQCPRPG